jgi:hypothetical protein
MVRLNEIEKLMKPQFIWDRAGSKILQTSETYEGAKDLARMIFVGIADMNGFDASNVQDYLDMTYDSHRNKIQQFRANLRESKRRVDEGSIFIIEDSIKKFYLKVSLCLNAIKHTHNQNAYLKIDNWLQHD